MWSVSSILSGLLSFMLDDVPTLGSIDMTDAQRRALAAKSLEENMRNKDFRDLFPQYVELHNKRKAKKGKDATTSNGNSSSSETVISGNGTNKNAQLIAGGDYSWRLVAVAVAIVSILLTFFWMSEDGSSS